MHLIRGQRRRQGELEAFQSIQPQWHCSSLKDILIFTSTSNFHHSWYNVPNMLLAKCLPRPRYCTRQPLRVLRVPVLRGLIFSTAPQSNPISGKARLLCSLRKLNWFSFTPVGLSATCGMLASSHLSKSYLFF